MTTLLASVTRFLDSNDTDGAREEVAKTVGNFKAMNANILDFAALLALGSQPALEIGLGVLGRKFLNRDQEINIDVIWLLLAAVLSRAESACTSPSRISILGLTSCVEDWESPIFALLTPALDSLFNASLSQGSPLIAEQTLDFIANGENSYAKAPRTKKQVKAFKSLTQSVLERVDDLELKEEWSEGLEIFLEIANKSKYSDENIWSDAVYLLKKIDNSNFYKSEMTSNEFDRVKDHISRLITSSLAAIETVFDGKGLSVAIRINSLEENNFWSVSANAIDKLERLFQEIADWLKIKEFPTFTPVQGLQGSWIQILHIRLNPEQATSLATAVKSLSSTLIEEIEDREESDDDLPLVNSWRECVAELKKDDIRVELAVSTNDPELYIVKAISTEDIEVSGIIKSLQHNVRVLSRDVPQADSLERVLELASLWVQYPSSPSTVQQKFLEIDGLVRRQFSYYRRSVEILGLVDERQRPTTTCYMLNRLPKQEQKMRFLAYQFISSNVGAAWFNWQDANELSQIQSERAAEFLSAVCPSLSQETIKRRASTLKSWLDRFLEYW
jgi:hypothetical protein